MTTQEVSKQESFNQRLRRFNKKYFNRFSLGFAGRPGSPWGVIEHHGRVSGRPYATPVVVRPQDGHFVIPLPYGTDVDWCQNVMATGEATVISGGEAFKVGEPTLIPVDEAISAFPDWMQEAATDAEDTQFLRVRKVSEDNVAFARLEEMHPIKNSVAILAGTVAILALIVILIKALTGKRGKPEEASEADTCC